MPIYEFRCDECGAVRELNLPRSEAGSKPDCECGQKMGREFSLAGISVKQTGTDHVLANLNARDDGIGNKSHIKEAMWKGLHQRNPVVGRGFGSGKN